MINHLFHALQIILPAPFKLPLTYRSCWASKKLENELLHIGKFLQPGIRAIDVGANRGLYSYILAKHFDVVESFEPQPLCAELIAAYSKAFGKQITVHQCALSSSSDELILYIPTIRGRLRTTRSTGLASLQKPKGDFQIIKVPVRTLDEYNFQDVSFIKIDVEGHEQQVIAGAKHTILRNKPILQIEIEQRHLGDMSVKVILDEINSLGYKGYFLIKDQLKSIDDYSYEGFFEEFLNPSILKDPTRTYINNIIFKPV
jgi:FkbM family methyltransferase